MIRAGLLSEENGHTVIALACEELAACGVTRRVNALVLLEDGQSCRERESTEDAELYRATSQSRRRTINRDRALSSEAEASPTSRSPPTPFP